MKRMFLFCVITFLLMRPGYSSDVTPSKISVGHNRFLKNQESTALIDLFQKLDFKLLRCGRTEAVAEHLKLQSPAIIEYVKRTYEVDLREYYEEDDPSIVFVGFLIMTAELESRLEDAPGSGPSFMPKKALDCVKAVLAGIAGVTAIVNSYQALLAGTASTQTIITLVSHIGKKFLGWIALGIAIYEFSECMGWV